MILEHGSLVHVEDAAGRTVLAEYNQYNGEYPYLSFFGTEWTGKPEDFPLVEVVKVVPRA
ncbi:hypothetical protein [Streptomyces sp. BBFR102]|uniref:hypothetical protein n=1 Tax=Streptomyces sp. BBFR102 TaxID=3448171 RepID=UPI003F536DEE